VAEPTEPAAVRARRLPGGLLLAAGLVATGLVLLFTIGVTKPGQPGPATASAQPVPPAGAQPVVPPGVVAPKPAVVAPPDRPRASDLAALDSWARGLATPTRLPANILAAYGRAEMWLRELAPGCHLSWVTLAGIGQVQAVGSGPLPVPDQLWQHWSARASSDGKPPDPRDVDDAALTAARALGYTQSATDTRDALTAATTYATATP